MHVTPNAYLTATRGLQIPVWRDFPCWQVCEDPFLFNNTKTILYIWKYLNPFELFVWGIGTVISGIN